MTTKPFTELQLLKKQLAEETKEKYSLYKRIKELRERLDALENKSQEMPTDSGPEFRQRHNT